MFLLFQSNLNQIDQIRLEKEKATKADSLQELKIAFVASLGGAKIELGQKCRCQASARQNDCWNH